MIRTYLDAGVLIAAARANVQAIEQIELILRDSKREFAASLFVQLEVLPKAIFNRRPAEVQFYKSYFATVRHWANPREACEVALEIASESGLNALDACHVAAAAAVANELITTESPGKPLYRTRRIQVVPLPSAKV